MAQVAVDLRHPDGSPALFNDSGVTIAYAPGTCLDVYGRLFGDVVRPRPHIGLPQAGYYGLRRATTSCSSTAATLLLHFLVAHGHGDMLSFEYSVGGQRLIVDPGVYEYNPGEWRASAPQATAAQHDSPWVTASSSPQSFGAFRCGRRARASCLPPPDRRGRFLPRGNRMTGFSSLPGRPRHVRRFEAGLTGIAVSDRVDDGERQPVVARLLVHPDWQIECQGQQAVLRCGDLRVRLTASASLRLESAWWCPDLGVRLQTRRLVLEYGTAPCQGGFRMERLDGP